MRWEHLFDDLESQLEQELGAEQVDLLAEEERLRLGRLGLRDRLRAMLPRLGPSAPLRVELVGGTVLDLTVGAIGRDWLAGELTSSTGELRSCVVPLAGIAACIPDETQLRASISAPTEGEAGVGELAGRLGLPFVLRDLCRRRSAVRITTATALLHGTIDRVARDHLDLAEHDPGEPRRASAIRTLRMVPIAQLVLVRF